MPPQQESHETTQPAQVTAGYDGQSAAGAKAKKAQPSAGVKVSILKFNKFRRENLKRKGA